MESVTPLIKTKESTSKRTSSSLLWYVIIILAVGFIMATIYSQSFNYRSVLQKLNRMRITNIPNCSKMKLSSANLEKFEDVNSIPGTTGPGVPKAMRRFLTDKYGGVNTSATSSYGAETGNFNIAFYSKLTCMNSFYFQLFLIHESENKILIALAILLFSSIIFIFKFIRIHIVRF